MADALLLSELLSDEELSSDEELCLFNLLADRPKASTGRHYRLDISSLSDAEVINLFRFKREDVVRLMELLRIPDPIIIARNGTKATNLEGLCILLRRMAYPNWWSDLVPLFGRSVPELSLISRFMVNHVAEQFGNLLTNFNFPWMQVDKLEMYCAAIKNQGAPLDSCWGFIDGTARPLARPIHLQRNLFSGHKRTHYLKFQSVMCPSGIIVNLFGPLEGKRHDSGMLAESGLMLELRKLKNVDGSPYYIYGDPAYPLSPHLMTPYRNAVLTHSQAVFNTKMSRVRQCVEWGFGKIIQYFAFLDFKKNLKLFLQPVGKYFIVGTILTNCHTCLYGSVTTEFFKIQPPSLEEYLNAA
ncbi:Uncharacterised protein r2_g751 [Pycnogonum litorale]